ncbi:hypothetical protein COU53_00290 [Candidatus Pacearchaeota archaeon CG10_big_fil_rev_8_21_14_0_10_30_48]|nr:MAG: hypothetical protein COU53_00290 [Candidatus Pacearchaeota archaeon CG10_big_fil_rev_8_21_14_0_10_30_48]
MVKRAIILSILIIVVIATIYLTFFYYPKCNDRACWDYKLRECSRASYLNEPVDVSWKYTILGKTTIDNVEKCEVHVLAVDIKRGLKKTEILKGKDMVCYLPLGVVATPENNPNICTGKLKEEMQSLIIQKLHEYIVQNLGEISNEIAQIEGVGNVNAGEIVVNSSA